MSGNPFKPPKKSAASDDDWMGTYADAITLLMAFFVMLLNFSKIDIPTFEEVQAGLAEQIGRQEVVRPMEILQTDITDAIFNMGMDSAVSLSTDDEGLLMELASNDFFKPGSAALKPEAAPFLAEMGDLLTEPRYLGFNVEVLGHTDDDPISTPRFPSNWELAAGRSIAVIRFFQAMKVESDRMRAVSYGETQPKLPNRDEDGVALPENKAKNRRVVVRVFPQRSRPIAGN
jgi:chemotaxis protein MotB